MFSNYFGKDYPQKISLFYLVEKVLLMHKFLYLLYFQDEHKHSYLLNHLQENHGPKLFDKTILHQVVLRSSLRFLLYAFACFLHRKMV